MRQVRTCDFCGNDATGLYEPLPSSIPDAPRLLLCDGCRDRLASVVDPLLSQIDGPGSGNAAASDADGIDHDSRESASETRADSRAPRADGTPRDTDAGSSTDAESRDRWRRPDEAVESPASAGPVEDVEGPQESSGDPAESAAVGESRDASGRAKRERAGTPHGYRKVMRFLENRELPIPRAEAERLATEAYELDEGAVSSAIDHGVLYGRLREVDGELKR